MQLLHGARFPVSETRKAVQPDSPDKHVMVPLVVGKSQPQKWRKAYELQLQDVDGLIAFSQCLVSTKTAFHKDANDKPVYLSTMVRCALVLTEKPLDLITVQAPAPGLVVSTVSDGNSTQKDNVTPYRPPARANVLQSPWKDPVLTLLVAVACETPEAAGTFAEVFCHATTDGHITAILFKAIDADYIRSVLALPTPPPPRTLIELHATDATGEWDIDAVFKPKE